MSAEAGASPGPQVPLGARAIAAALLLLVLWPGPGHGQEPAGDQASLRRRPPVVVAGGRGLRFGRIFRGTPSSVSPASSRSAQFVIIGFDSQIQVSFVLPSGLVSSSGELLPVQFGPGDGILFRLRRFRREVFDPTRPLTITIDRFDLLRLRLGGTAMPGAAQPLGRYRGTVIVVVADLST